MSTITEILNQDISIKNLWMIKCSAIWLPKPVLTSKGLTGRIAIGDAVNATDGVICSDGEQFKYKVDNTMVNIDTSVAEIRLKSFLDGSLISVMLYN